MEIGITGKSGFLGKAFSEVMESRGHSIRDFSGDITKREALVGFFDGCDVVVHLAGVFSDEYDQLMDVNVFGTRNVVDACVKSGIGSLVFASTGAVYGERDGKPAMENDPLDPNTLYGLSKRYAEEYVAFSGIRRVILRFSSIYGPGNEKGVISNFIRSVKKDGVVKIFGTGEQKRDFVYVDDVVNALIRAVEWEGVSETFNISGGIAYSLNEIVDILKEHGLLFEEVHEDFEASNALRVLSQSNKKAVQILHWEPSVGFEEGIRRTIGQ